MDPLAASFSSNVVDFIDFYQCDCYFSRKTLFHFKLFLVASRRFLWFGIFILETGIPRGPGQAWGGQGSSPGDSGKLPGRPGKLSGSLRGALGASGGPLKRKFLDLAMILEVFLDLPRPTLASWGSLGTTWQDIRELIEKSSQNRSPRRWGSWVAPPPRLQSRRVQGGGQKEGKEGSHMPNDPDGVGGFSFLSLK